MCIDFDLDWWHSVSMRLWSIHPRYLDSSGLVAHWRETLLAQSVLHDETKGYRNHPQLIRFKELRDPCSGTAQYLESIFIESKARGYRFDGGKIRTVHEIQELTVTEGQVAYEWQHLLTKLKRRSHDLYLKWKDVKHPDLHPMFKQVEGGVASWEKV